jgi:hypothetical protein
MSSISLGVWVAFFKNSLIHCLAERPKKIQKYFFELRDV